MAHGSRAYNGHISDFTHRWLLLRRKQNSKSLVYGTLNSAPRRIVIGARNGEVAAQSGKL
jgi:hypothetical protein